MTPRERERETKPEIIHNKFSLFFNELAERSLNLHIFNSLLKTFENFKPFWKYFYKLIKTFDLDKDKIKIRRILVVDDNKLILKALKKKCRMVLNELNLKNVEVISAYDGVDALGIFKIDYYLGPSIDIIISDYNMNMMNGGEFLRLVDKYRDNRDIKLFICSTDNDAYKSSGLPNVEFLSKDATKSELKKLLKHLQKE